MSNKANLQPSFQANIDSLVRQSQAEEARIQTQFAPGSVVISPSSVIERSSPPTIVQAFDRSDINLNYEEVVGGSPPGTVADMVTLKEQNDFIAARERALLLSSCSAVRTRVHSSLRRASCGAANGVFLNSVIKRVSDPLTKQDQVTEIPE